MALDLQQRPAQHGHRRHHTRYETENGRVVLQADPIKNGEITVEATNLKDFLGMNFRETELFLPEYIPMTAWLEHGPFAMWLVRKMKPRRIVELGTHYGYSYFAMCQAVRELDIPADCFAIETWGGDEDGDVYESVVKENQKYSDFSHLLRKTSADALAEIEDSSVDLLHVDGRYDYEDVKEDFETWIPKLSPSAVVLFHNTEERKQGFGVNKYWEELSKERPSINFLHCHGLGVLFWGEETHDGLKDFSELTKNPVQKELVVEYFSAVSQTLVALRNVSDRDALIAQISESLKHAEENLKREENLRIKAELENTILAERNLVSREDLAEARRHPIKPLTDKIKYNILKKVLKHGISLSPKTRARFDKSARKRDPNRSLHDTVTSHDREGDYRIWMQSKEINHHLNAEQIAKINTKAEQSSLTISIVMPVYNPSPVYLEECLRSVMSQSFQNWQFCIADDASTDPKVRSILEKYAASDPRIHVVFRPENGHISAASNSALEIATGTFIALLDHDDMLPKHALAHIAHTVLTQPNAQLIYSDEDKLNDAGERVDPHFKSDWNRDLFYTHNYITHLTVLDRKIVEEIGGFRLGFEGAQDYDLLLRAIALMKDENIVHIPKILYHWRAHSGSTARVSGAKSYTHDAGKKALTEFLHRHENSKIIVDDGLVENLYHVVWPVPAEEPKVTLIIPTRDHIDLLRAAVTSVLDKTDYTNYDIVIVDNGSVEPETLAWFDVIQGESSKVRVLAYDAPFNYSAINNFAVKHTDADIIALVNNDVEVIGPRWLREMVGHALRADIGCVGAKLHYTNGQIQHGGVIIGIGKMAGHSHKLYDGTHHGYFGRLFATQNLSAVTGACLVLRRSIYDAVHGLDADNLAIACNDIDLCLKVQAEGYRNLWSPHASLYHHESISRGHEDTPEKQARYDKEADFMLDKWKPDQNPDPYYNPNLTLVREDFSIDTSRD